MSFENGFNTGVELFIVLRWEFNPQVKVNALTCQSLSDESFHKKIIQLYWFGKQVCSIAIGRNNYILQKLI